LKLQAYELYKEYNISVSTANSQIRRHEKDFISLVESIEGIEESRISFSVTLLTKYFRFIDHIVSLYSLKSQSIKSAISRMQYQFPGINKLSPDYPFTLIKQLSHNFPVHSLKGDTSGESFKSDTEFFKEESKNALETLFDGLQGGEQITADDKLNAIDWMSTMEARGYFASMLKAFSLEFPVLSKEDYQTILELCNYLLTEWIAKNDNNVDILNNLLLASRGILKQTDGTKEFLYTQLIRHGIWQENDIWRKLIDKSIKVRISHIKMTQDKKAQGRSLAGLFSKMKSAVTTGMTKMIIKEDTSESLESKGAISVLSHFCYYLSNPAIDINKIIKMYKDYANAYDISQKRFGDLKIELMRCQKEPSSVLDKVKEHFKRIESKNKKYGKFFILSSVVKYLGDKITLRNLLLLNKKSYKVLKIKVFRQVLMKLDIKISIGNHMKIWEQILEPVFNLIII